MFSNNSFFKLFLRTELLGTFEYALKRLVSVPSSFTSVMAVLGIKN
jgi:hypothetical protein